jgi:hypothetical protein
MILGVRCASNEATYDLSKKLLASEPSIQQGFGSGVLAGDVDRSLAYSAFTCFTVGTA